MQGLGRVGRRLVLPVLPGPEAAPVACRVGSRAVGLTRTSPWQRMYPPLCRHMHTLARSTTCVGKRPRGTARHPSPGWPPRWAWSSRSMLRSRRLQEQSTGDTGGVRCAGAAPGRTATFGNVNPGCGFGSEGGKARGQVGRARGVSKAGPRLTGRGHGAMLQRARPAARRVMSSGEHAPPSRTLVITPHYAS